MKITKIEIKTISPEMDVSSGKVNRVMFRLWVTIKFKKRYELLYYDVWLHQTELELITKYFGEVKKNE